MPGEFELIRRYFSADDRAPGVVLGVGDDCALLEVPEGMTLAVTTDTMTEGVHFFPGTDPTLLGYKALAVNLSDLAAMGAAPWTFTLALNLERPSDRFLEGFAAGLLALARAEGIALVGGNTARGQLSFTIEACGLLPRGEGLRRSGARPGDLLVVTGDLGLPGLYVEAGYERIALPETTFRALENRAMCPPCRLKFARELHGLATAAIDISDGIIGDLRHILERSGVGATLWLDQLPENAALSAAGLPPSICHRLAALGGGDYELLLTVPEEHLAAVQALGERHQVPLTVVGRIEDADGLRLTPEDWLGAISIQPFEHFQGQA